jgi:CRP/FNR family cyclic AMP-dependent transcriptional regulator
VPRAPLDALRRVRLFADLNKRELSQIARLFKLREFPAGETVIKEGSGRRLLRDRVG